MDVAGRSRTISDFARWIASIPPNSPACASPTLSTTEMSGVAIATSRAISPSWLAPISTTRYSVCSSTRSIEIGAPTWLLNDPCGATVGPSASSTARSRFLVVVLPLEPVIATIRSFPAARTRSTTSRAMAARAATPSGTISCGTATSSARSATTSAAPASTAAGANRCPSVSSPGRAKNTEPAPTSRESVSTVPDDDRVGRPHRSGRSRVPPSACASSARVSAITPSPPRAERPAPARGPSTASGRPRCRGSPGAPVLPRGWSRPRGRATRP